MFERLVRTVWADGGDGVKAAADRHGDGDDVALKMSH